MFLKSEFLILLGFSVPFCSRRCVFPPNVGEPRPSGLSFGAPAFVVLQQGQYFLAGVSASKQVVLQTWKGKKINFDCLARTETKAIWAIECEVKVDLV
jgi:hypothetical protein